MRQLMRQIEQEDSVSPHEFWQEVHAERKAKRKEAMRAGTPIVRRKLKQMQAREDDIARRAARHESIKRRASW